MLTARRLVALCCMCLLSSCSYLNTDDLTVTPGSTHASSKPLDPNCDRYATSGGGSFGCTPVGQGQPRDKQGQRIPLSPIVP
jgi:hypothetical protein